MGLHAGKHQTISNSTFFILLFALSYKLISFFLFYYKCFLVFTLDTLKNFVQTYEL